ncbi:MAG: hypothetical protein SOW08_00230 [Lachnospiraceae bacterium]|nr:hypothetical protein [Lachnospiraceae bacterium]
MSKRIRKLERIMVFVVLAVFCLNITVCAQENDVDISCEQESFVEYDDQINDIGEIDQYADGIYNVGTNARASMSGLIRIYQSSSKLACVYSTEYSHTVNKVGVKNIKLQYKGSLGIWHNIITLDDRYATNTTEYMGSFSCTGVVGRVYRVKGTHYIVDGSYTQSRDNVTGELTFR